MVSKLRAAGAYDVISHGAAWRDAVQDYAAPLGPRRAAQLDRLRHWRAPGWQEHFALVDALLARVTTPAAQLAPYAAPRRAAHVAVRDAAVQMQRLRARDEHLTEEEARDRVKAQWDVRDKAERCLRRGDKAGVVVWNDGGKEDLKKDIDRVMATVQEGSPQWWAWLLLLFPPLGVLSGGWSYVRSWYIKRQWEQEKAREKAKL